MKFKNLKEKCEYYRSLTDYKLLPNGYIILMLDGHCFSRMVKKKFKLPFDEKFMNAMNDTAAYLVSQIQGAKFAYVQSDEISILITDFDTPETDSCFGYRLCKMQSLFASMASTKFNQIMAANTADENVGMITLPDIEKMPLYIFDCKAWTVPSYNDAFAWFLWRQNDCTRNSMQQAAQTYLPHKALLNKTADEQIALLKAEKGIDWNMYSNGEKYGRLIYSQKEPRTTIVKGETIHFERNVWKAFGALPFVTSDNMIKKLIPKRNEDNKTDE